MSNKDKKEELLKQEVPDEELDNVAGGGCWFGARFEAPDGHDVGCRMIFYDNKLDFSAKFPSICYSDGGPHECIIKRYGGQDLLYCRKCDLPLNGADNTYQFH